MLRHETAVAAGAVELNYTRGACIIGDLLCCGCAAGEIIVIVFLNLNLGWGFTRIFVSLTLVHSCM